MGVLLQIIGTGVLSWLLWRILHAYIRSSPFDGVPGPKPFSVLTGHFGALMSYDYWAFLQEICENYGGVIKLQGLLGEKFLYISDHVALHTMFVKEPGAFEETPEFLIGNQLLFGTGLAAASGDIHRKQRKLLNPAFSPTHLRQLTPVFLHVAEILRTAIAREVKDGPSDVNLASWTGRGALEIVGQGAMGYSFDPLVDSVPNDYAIALRSLMPTVFSVALHWFFIPWSIYLGPPKFRRWLLDHYPNQKAQKLKNIVDTVWSKSVSLVKQRKASLESGDEGMHERIGGGKDIMSILLRANMEASEQDRLPDEQLVAQVNTIVFAASDTTSNGLSRVLYTLVEHPKAQDRLRQEIVDFRKSGEELTYDRLVELPYLDAVVRETLRVYPPVLSMDRIAQRDIVLPLSKPITDTKGSLIHEVPITQGSSVSIGIFGFNRSRDVWGDDASEWKPERWLTPLPASIKNASSGGVFYNLMTFAGGPRSCIGFKYAELEIKTFLLHIIESFKLSPGKADIIWNTSFVVFPSVTKGSSKAEMPLRVELIQSLSS